MAKRDAGSATVTTKLGDDGQEVNQDYVFKPLDVPAGTPLAEISVSFGVTVNLGSYESARVDVGLRMPCLPERGAETFMRAKEWVENVVRKEVRTIKGKA